MDAAAFAEVVELACDATGIDRAPPTCGLLLVSDRGPALISTAFGDHLWAHLTSTWGYDYHGLRRLRRIEQI